MFRFLAQLVELYELLIFAYVIMSWFVAPGGRGALASVYRSLGAVCEPYLSLFRRLIRPVMVGGGGIDFSPFLALFVLQIVMGALSRLG